MYAIIKSGGKQYRVEKDSVISVDLLDHEAGSEFETSDVLFLKSAENEFKIGNPFIGGVKVSAKVLEHYRGTKIVIFKKKRRKGYRRKQGHRQNYSKIQITGIHVS